MWDFLLRPLRALAPALASLGLLLAALRLNRSNNELRDEVERRDAAAAKRRIVERELSDALDITANDDRPATVKLRELGGLRDD